MTMTLSSLRQKRDATELQQLQARNETIRSKLVPMMLQDIRGELDEATGLTLLELCDDLEIDETQYTDLQRTARAISQDLERASEIQPKLENEKLRFAKLTLAKRRSEMLTQAAEKASRRQRSMRETQTAYQRELDLKREAFPFFFDCDGEPLPELRDLPRPEQPPLPVVKMSTCAICLCEFANVDGSDYCSNRCDHIAEQHFDALVELKIIKRKSKS